MIPSNYGASIASWACSGGDSLSGTTCSQYATSTYGATPSYVCNAGDSLNGSTCTHTASSTYGASVSAWACNAGDSLSGSTCTKTTASNATPNYSCASGTLSGSTCIGGRKQSETMYVYLTGRQIAEVTAGVTQYPHTDALGSPVAHSSAAGALLNRTRFEPYGFPAAGTKPSKATSVIGFTGHVQDSETDLVYMQQRYYDPMAARFLSIDPISTNEEVGSLFSRYAYAANSPISYIDPDGRQTFYTQWGAAAYLGPGVEGSVGVYLSFNPKIDVGVFVTGGYGGGAAAGGSWMTGVVKGPISNFQGDSYSGSISTGLASVGFTLNSDFDITGVSFGPAAKFGVSGAKTTTHTCGIRDCELREAMKKAAESVRPEEGNKKNDALAGISTFTSSGGFRVEGRLDSKALAKELDSPSKKKEKKEEKSD